MGNIKYALKRFIASLPSILGSTVIVFLLIKVIPGDPVDTMLYDNSGDPAVAEALREQLGLTRPLYVQYTSFLFAAAQGNLGSSLVTGRPVITEIMTYLPVTIKLAALSLGLAMLIGIPIGAVAAIRHRSWLDQLVMMSSVVGVSMPIFFLGVLLIQLFSVKLGWLPATYGGNPSMGLLLPAVSLALMPSALIARLTRDSLLKVLPQNYIRTARSKGLAPSVVILRHALRNALIPVVTIIGVQLGSLLSGAVIAEVVFTVPGIGVLIVESIEKRDYMVVQGAILYMTILYISINMIVDIVYYTLDPRISR